MAEEGFRRKLTTMFSADVAGYSRLMGEDEAATVKTLTTYRSIMMELIKQHRGRVVDSPGDNLLAEFTSVVDAVQCAVAVQKEFQARNAELPEDRRMAFRIGINLGDVIEEGDRIYGDGLNIAARLEGLADPGGICISKTAFDQIETKLPLGYDYLGEQTVKNIAKPVGAYQVLMEPRVTVAGKEEKVLPLPEEPSIAVLPFANISGDPEQEYFSDGLTEEIITALSKIHNMFVIARNSTFAYKGKPVKMQQVGEELGVRYVLEGSVRKAGDRVRITAQLVDATTGGHVWSERYDREMADIFDIQDEITMNVVPEIQAKLTEGEQALVRRKRGTNNLKAWEKYIEGIGHYMQFNREGIFKARQLGEEAIALDPNYSEPYVIVGGTHLMDISGGWTEDAVKSLGLATDFAQKALTLDESSDAALNLWGGIHLFKGENEKAVDICKRAVALNPNLADSFAFLGMALTHVSRYAEAITAIEKATRLNPFPPDWYSLSLALAYNLMGKYDEAIAECKKALDRNPDQFFVWMSLTLAYSLSGREKEAGEAASEVLRLDPGFSVKRYIDNHPATDPERLKLEREGLLKAGLPE
jgi:adenylate cyclase